MTITTLAWAINKSQQTPTKFLTLALIMMQMSFWSFMGVAPEELFLVFLPLCISFGIICSCLFTRSQRPGESVVLGDEKMGFGYEV
jgi:hypothetical protein